MAKGEQFGNAVKSVGNLFGGSEKTVITETTQSVEPEEKDDNITKILIVVLVVSIVGFLIYKFL
jgi:hypothetical protein